MVFSSSTFLFLFLPFVVLAYYLTRRWLGHTPAIAFLLIASLVFYSWWDVRYLPLLVGSIALNFLAAHMIIRGAQFWLPLGIAANLGLLGLFKYADFAVANFNLITGLDLPPPGLPLPLAISFFTFQQIAFLVDTSRRQTQPGKLHHYSLFVAFFPQLIAGPIVHHRTLAPQIEDKGKQSALAENLGVGSAIFAVGLAKKVLLADSLAPYANAAFDTAANGEPVGLALAWTGMLAYTLQIYFDFSGYSDMAMGLARMFGFQLPVNFNAPYKSRSITEFWRRWHITLSQFLRDYLYIPLGGNRAGKVQSLINLAIVMLLGGLWHGAGWTFVVWGGLHGLALIWCRLLDSAFPNGLFGRFGWVSVFCTVFFVSLTWVFFRAESFASAMIMFEGLAGLSEGNRRLDDDPFIAAAIGFLLVFVLPETAQIFDKYIDKDLLKSAGVTPARRFSWSPGVWSAIGLGLLLFLGVTNTWRYSEFIYYNF